MSNPNNSDSPLSSIKEAAGDAVDAVEQTAKQGVDAAGDTLSAAKETAQNVAEDVREGAERVFNDAKDAIGEATSAGVGAGAVAGLTQESKNMALLGWIGAIFFGFIPGLVLYLMKKDDTFVVDHAKENLNFSITYAIAFFACMVLSVIVIGAFLMPIVAIAYLVFCIIAAVKASNGETYRVPFILRLLK